MKDFLLICMKSIIQCCWTLYLNILLFIIDVQSKLKFKTIYFNLTATTFSDNHQKHCQPAMNITVSQLTGHQNHCQPVINNTIIQSSTALSGCHQNHCQPAIICIVSLSTAALPACHQQYCQLDIKFTVTLLLTALSA